MRAGATRAAPTSSLPHYICLKQETAAAMPSAKAEPIRIAVGDNDVSGLLLAPPHARACTVLAHGAGAGVNHPFMATVADGLAERHIATLRYQFLYMERGSKRPDPPAARPCARSAPRSPRLRDRTPGLPLIAGGKSFGGRMTSQAQASAPLPNVRGLAFLRLPAAPGRSKPSRERGTAPVRCARSRCCSCRARATHWRCSIRLSRCAKSFGARATLRLYDGADHSFPRAGAKRTDRRGDHQRDARRVRRLDRHRDRGPAWLTRRKRGNKARTFSQIFSSTIDTELPPRDYDWFAAVWSEPWRPVPIGKAT